MSRIPKNIVWLVSGILLGSGGYHLFFHFRGRRLHPLNVIKYVFFKHNGNPFILTDREIYEIKHKYEDGVLVSSIAQGYKIDAAMICRIINYLKWL